MDIKRLAKTAVENSCDLFSKFKVSLQQTYLCSFAHLYSCLVVQYYYSEWNGFSLYYKQTLNYYDKYLSLLPLLRKSVQELLRVILKSFISLVNIFFSFIFLWFKTILRTVSRCILHLEIKIIGQKILTLLVCSTQLRFNERP